MNLFMKQEQTHRHREQTCGCQGGGDVGRDGVGVWDQQMQAIIYRMDKQEWINNKVLLYSTGNYIQHPVINHNGKGYKKKNVQMCITESLGCTAEMGTTL